MKKNMRNLNFLVRFTFVMMMWGNLLSFLCCHLHMYVGACICLVANTVWYAANYSATSIRKDYKHELERKARAIK